MSHNAGDKENIEFREESNIELSFILQLSALKYEKNNKSLSYDSIIILPEQMW